MICKFGLLGHPLSHSLSPLIHETLIELYGTTGSYELFDLTLEELEEGAIGHLIMGGVNGLNVTIPYKVLMAEKLQVLTPEARRMGAVNTIMRMDVEQEISLIGHNTDGSGFFKSLPYDTKQVLRGGNVMMLGAGGAARAVLCSLLFENEAPPAWVTVVLRDVSKGTALLSLWSEWCGEAGVSVPMSLIAFDALRDEQLADTQVLINSTPVGMYPETNAMPLSLLQLEALNPEAHVHDLIYNPSETVLMREAKNHGCPVVQNGLGMLIFQGMEAFSAWTKLPLHPEWASIIREKLELTLAKKSKTP